MKEWCLSKYPRIIGSVVIILVGIGFSSGFQGNAAVRIVIATCVAGVMALLWIHGFHENWYIRLSSTKLEIRNYKNGEVESFTLVDIHSAKIVDKMELGAYEGAALKRCLVIQTELEERTFELPILNAKIENIVEEIRAKIVAIRGLKSM